MVNEECWRTRFVADSAMVEDGLQNDFLRLFIEIPMSGSHYLEGLLWLTPLDVYHAVVEVLVLQLLLQSFFVQGLYC